MVRVFTDGIRIPVPGSKVIEEHIGNVSSKTDKFSVAHMTMPAGWSEPPHGTKYDELVIVIKGELTIVSGGENFRIQASQVCWVEPSVNVVFCNTSTEICEYWAICVPAFSPDRVIQIE